MRNLLALASLSIFLVLPAWGIGRSGNGTINSSVTGFSAQTPENFGISERLEHDQLRLISPIVDIRPGMMNQIFLELGGIEQMLGDFTGLKRAEVEAKAKDMGWVKQPFGNSCVDVFVRNSEIGDLLATFWGESKGLIVIGPHSPYVRNGEQELLSTLKLEPGACAW